MKPVKIIAKSTKNAIKSAVAYIIPKNRTLVNGAIYYGALRVRTSLSVLQIMDIFAFTRRYLNIFMNIRKISERQSQFHQ